MAEERDAQRQVRPYVKPCLKKVPLKPEEAVLTGCKTSQSAGYRTPNCSRGGACQKLKS